MRRPGHHAAHRRALVAQPADQLKALIGGDATRDDQQNAPAFQQFGSPCLLRENMLPQDAKHEALQPASRFWVARSSSMKNCTTSSISLSRSKPSASAHGVASARGQLPTIAWIAGSGAQRIRLWAASPPARRNAAAMSPTETEKPGSCNERLVPNASLGMPSACTSPSTMRRGEASAMTV